MNKTILIIVAVVAAIAVVALAAFVLLSGPKWDDPVDNWVLSQDVNEGDYIQYMDKYTVASVSGNTCEVRKNSETATTSMSKQDFLRLLSAKEQLARYFSGSYYSVSAHYEKDESYGSLRYFEGEVRTDRYGFMDEFDIDMFIDSHNILETVDIEDFGIWSLRTNLPFVNF